MRLGRLYWELCQPADSFWMAGLTGQMVSLDASAYSKSLQLFGPMLVQAVALHVLKGGLDVAPGLGGAIGATFRANALMNRSFFRGFRTMDHEELASEFDDGCVMHADLPFFD
jgi:hypothetical protein